jgi:ribonucleoside-diphosphate reductase alpha chain
MRDAPRCDAQDPPDLPAYLARRRSSVADEVLEAGRRVHGYRNAQVTVLAPTGTIGFMMDCDTTGVEPDIALVKYKLLAGGGMLKIVNRTVRPALEKLGYDEPTINGIINYIDKNDTIEGGARPEARAPAGVRLCLQAAQRRALHRLHAHIRMMAAVQPFLSGAISKTVNMPHEATPKRSQTYIDGWKLGLKALAIYRDGCKRKPAGQHRQAKEKKAEAVAAADGSPACRREGAPAAPRMPSTRQSVTHKFDIAGHEGYLTVGLYDDGLAGRAVHHHGQGRQHGRRPDGRLRHRHLHVPAVRRAGEVADREVRAHRGSSRAASRRTPSPSRSPSRSPRRTRPPTSSAGSAAEEWRD